MTTSTTTTFTCECGQTLAAHNDNYHGPTIGICGHTGADWDTLLTVLTDVSSRIRGMAWFVIVYLADGTRAEGSLHYSGGDVMRLVQRDKRGNDTDDVIEIDMVNVLHIQIG